MPVEGLDEPAEVGQVSAERFRVKRSEQLERLVSLFVLLLAVCAGRGIYQPGRGIYQRGFTSPAVAFTSPAVAFTSPAVAFTSPAVAFTSPAVAFTSEENTPFF